MITIILPFMYMHAHAQMLRKEGVLIHEIGNATSIIWILKGMVSRSVIRTMHWGHVITIPQSSKKYPSFNMPYSSLKFMHQNKLEKIV